MKAFFLVSTIFFANLASAVELRCQFVAPNVDEFVTVPVTTGISTFEKTLNDFSFALNLDKDFILAITLKDNARKVTSSTIATTGAAIFGKPRTLSMNSDGRYAEVSCF